MILLRGQCPQELDTAINIDSQDPVEQTHKVMQNIRELVQESGGQIEHVTKLVVYLTDVRHRDAVYRKMGEYIKSVFPVCTGLVAVALARRNGWWKSMRRLSSRIEPPWKAIDGLLRHRCLVQTGRYPSH